MVELGLLCRWRVGNLVLTFPVQVGWVTVVVVGWCGNVIIFLLA